MKKIFTLITALTALTVNNQFCMQCTLEFADDLASIEQTNYMTNTSPELFKETTDSLRDQTATLKESVKRNNVALVEFILNKCPHLCWIAPTVQESLDYFKNLNRNPAILGTIKACLEGKKITAFDDYNRLERIADYL